MVLHNPSAAPRALPRVAVAAAVALPLFWLASEAGETASTPTGPVAPAARERSVAAAANGQESDEVPGQVTAPRLSEPTKAVARRGAERVHQQRRGQAPGVARSGPAARLGLRGGARSGAASGASGQGAGPGGNGGGVGLKDPPPPASVFQFKMLQDVPFFLTLQTTDDQALPGVRVSVLGSLAPPAPGQTLEDVTSPDVFFDGFSDGLGQLTVSLSLPASVSAVDVVVITEGFSGDYTHEELRAFWGPFAPAARVTLPVGQLNSLSLVLAKN